MDSVSQEHIKSNIESSNKRQEFYFKQLDQAVRKNIAFLQAFINNKVYPEHFHTPNLEEAENAWRELNDLNSWLAHSIEVRKYWEDLLDKNSK